MIQMEFYGHIYGFMFVTRVHCGWAWRHASRLSHKAKLGRDFRREIFISDAASDA